MLSNLKLGDFILLDYLQYFNFLCCINQNYSDIFNTNIVTFDPNRYMPIWNSGNGIIVGEANNGQSYSVGGDYEFVKTGVFVNNFANYTPTILVGCYLSQLNTTNFTTCTKVTATRIA